jgi:hypothetical protein
MAHLSTETNIAAIDLFVVPTIRFDLIYAFVIVRLEDVPVSRPVQRAGIVSSHAIPGDFITTTFGCRFRYTHRNTAVS